MPLRQWPKHPIIGFMLIVTAVYLHQIPGLRPYFWVPVAALVVLLILTRKWTAAPFVALALLILGLYFSIHYGEWELFEYRASFWYAVLYTVAILTMGVRFIVLYWGKDRYMIYRTCFNMGSQLFIGFMAAYLLPYEWMGGGKDTSGSGVFFMYVWPLEVNAFLIGKYQGLHRLVKIFLAYNLVAALVAMPLLVYYHGRKPYCSWLCGCGCLAETFGDPFRRLTPRSRWARKLEPVIWVFVVASIVFTIYA
ncbi:MAG: 4Fe-4S binding protein, partial [Armatimonadota bacterium]